MARTDNLGNFLIDVANSIREKTGKTDKIPASEFDTEIENIKMDPVLQDKDLVITENGIINVTPDEGYDGLNSVEVTVNVEGGSSPEEKKYLYLIKDGVEQIENTGGYTLASIYGGTGNNTVTQGDGFLGLCAQIWSCWTMTFKHKIDFSRYPKLYIEYAYPQTTNTYAYNNVVFSMYRVNSKTEDILINKTGVKQKTLDVLDFSHSAAIEQLQVRFGNSGDGTGYANYPIQLFNLYFEENPKPLQNKDVEITQNGITEVTFDEEYAGLNKVQITTNVESSVSKYAPRRISFKDYKGTELTDEIANLDTSNVTDMKEMFYGCTALTDLNMNDFNTSNVTNMSSMFQNCNALTSLDISNFNMSNVTNTQYMFSGCKAITSIDLHDKDISKSTSALYMFSACSSLVDVNLSGVRFDKITSYSNMFNGCSSLKNVNIDNWTMNGITNTSAGNMFDSCSALENLNINHWTNCRINSFYLCFRNCTNLKTVKFNDVSFYYLTTMEKMFENCTSLEEIDFSGSNYWGDTRSVTLQQCFYNCSNLKKIDMRTFNLSNAMNTSQAFQNVPADCLIIVKDDTCKTKILTMRSDFTNVKTVAELEASE